LGLGRSYPGILHHFEEKGEFIYDTKILIMFTYFYISITLFLFAKSKFQYNIDKGFMQVKKIKYIGIFL
jgi:hypothetical protein